MKPLRISGKTLKTVYTALGVAVGLVLPFLTGGIPVVGKTLSPMHFPVFITGFAAGPFCGLIAGAVTPILRFFLFGAPSPIYPRVFRMMAELAAYGFFAGFFYRKLPKKTVYIYVSLIGAMIAGRLVYTATWFIMTVFDPANEFYLEAVLSSVFASSAFGMLFQLILIPPVIAAIKKSRHA